MGGEIQINIMVGCETQTWAGIDLIKNSFWKN
jgi:hypothetical protein